MLTVDDDTMVRYTLKRMLGEMPDTECIGEATDGEEAYHLAARLKPDVILMDIRINRNDTEGIQTTRRILERWPQARVIALSVYNEKETVLAMLAAGASGFLPKDKCFAELGDAIRTVVAGKQYVSKNLRVSASDLIRVGHGGGPYRNKKRDSSAENRTLTDQNPLTEREREVRDLIADGLSSKEIAERLGICIKTVDAHRQNIMRKLNVHKATQLVDKSVRES